MKKFSLVSLAVAAALAICPTALVAQNYDFTFHSTIPANGDSATGTLVISLTANSDGSYNVISGTITLNGTGPLSLVPGSGTSESGLFTYDDLLYPADNGSGGYLTSENYGLLFENGTDAVELNLWSNQPNGTAWGSGSTYGLWTENGGSWGPTEDAGTFTLTAVPEYGSLSMLVLCGLGLAGVFFFRGWAVRAKKCVTELA